MGFLKLAYVLAAVIPIAVGARPRGSPIETYDGTDGGKNCSFPYLYGGEAKFTCVVQSGDTTGRLHCGTEYFRDFYNTWSFCKYRNCQATPAGLEYMGTISTAKGKTCQRWEAQKPHAHTMTDPAVFLGATGWDDISNYCRNPDGDTGGPWCFTTDPSERWMYCQLPACEDECLGNLLTGISQLADSGLSASSTRTLAGTTDDVLFSRLDFTPGAGEAGAWCAASDTGEWIEAKFSTTHRVMGLVTKARADEEAWVSKFELGYTTTTSGDAFDMVKNATGQNLVFEGNWDSLYPMAHLLDEPIFGKRFRLYPTESVNQTCLRWDLIGCADTDSCASGPCKNGGTCRDFVGGFECMCNSNYTGATCEDIFEFCESSPCKNEGKCINVLGSYDCDCLGGFGGDHCEITSHESCLSLAKAGVNVTGIYSIPFYKDVVSPGCKMILQYEGLFNQLEGSKIYSNDTITKDECLALCLTMPDCYAASWMFIISTCQLDKAEGDVYIHSGEPHLKYDGYYRKVCQDDYMDIFCDFSNLDFPATHIPHNTMENRTTDHRSGDRSFANGVVYGSLTWERLAELKYHSINCSQSAIVFCKASDGAKHAFRFFNGDAPPIRSNYFGIDSCQCVLGDVCLTSQVDCNCNDEWGWTGDSDIFTQKELLPIRETLHGDTDSSWEEWIVSFSELICVQSVYPMDECASNPCANGGTCTDDYNFFTCECVPGYTGKTCEMDIKECASDPCQHGGACLEQLNGYACSCKPGYTGTECETDIDECASKPCFNNASCVDLENRWRCICRPGFSGSTCDEDRDECGPEPCQNGGTCEDLINDYKCICPTGYAGKKCQDDINECENDPCLNGGNCTDLIGDFACDCVDGFSGDTCAIDDDECLLMPCLNGGTCSDKPGWYECACPKGFLGHSCETDIYECASQPCLNDATCLDGANSFACDCGSGYNGTYCEREINECQSHPCLNRAPCRDGIGSYTCDCRDGFTGVDCESDIDECRTNPCKNGGTCENEIGSFQCACRPGLAGKTCELLSVNGQWSGWGAWSKCQASCGYGVQTRKRECNNPSPANGGKKCEEGHSDFQICQNTDCVNVDGRWSRWAEWSRCSASCGEGQKTRRRICNNPAPSGTGTACVGPINATLNCKDHECGDPIDGRWSFWGPWSDCSAEGCDLDIVFRNRTCSDPPAQYGGKICEGDDLQAQPCKSPTCTGIWSEEDYKPWSDWTKCDTPCGSGKRRKERSWDEELAKPENGVTDQPGIAPYLLTEYEHEHCENRQCQVFQCMECSGEYVIGQDPVSNLLCRGPRRNCPGENPYCVQSFVKTGNTVKIKKSCGLSDEVCNVNMSSTCLRLRKQAIDNMRTYQPVLKGPLQPHPDTVMQVLESDPDDLDCQICCTSSMCNVGILPPSMFIESAAASIFTNIHFLISTIFCVYQAARLFV